MAITLVTCMVTFMRYILLYHSMPHVYQLYYLSCSRHSFTNYEFKIKIIEILNSWNYDVNNSDNNEFNRQNDEIHANFQNDFFLWSHSKTLNLQIEFKMSSKASNFNKIQFPINWQPPIDAHWSRVVVFLQKTCITIFVEFTLCVVTKVAVTLVTWIR